MQIRVDTNYSWSGNSYIATDHKTKTYENGLAIYTSEKRVYDINLYSSLGIIQNNQPMGSTVDLLV